ncbi:hypothetical protein RRG08_005236 [Elysia crispata]|uniref:Uncharacterized protein n=1 Tax=Elysia crispata TaxID=231223 RepID=A0AAE1E0U6_9GAST|nr:hypothetical protein RRG08_005236 [Elysia crispata]
MKRHRADEEIFRCRYPAHESDVTAEPGMASSRTGDSQSTPNLVSRRLLRVYNEIDTIRAWVTYCQFTRQKRILAYCSQNNELDPGGLEIWLDIEWTSQTTPGSGQLADSIVQYVTHCSLSDIRSNRWHDWDPLL